MIDQRKAFYRQTIPESSFVREETVGIDVLHSPCDCRRVYSIHCFKMMMKMMNCFCGMVDRRKASSLISSWDHCQRSLLLRIWHTVSSIWTIFCIILFVNQSRTRFVRNKVLLLLFTFYFVTFMNDDRKTMQCITITSRLASRKRKWNQLSQFRWTFSKVIPIENT